MQLEKANLQQLVQKQHTTILQHLEIQLAINELVLQNTSVCSTIQEQSNAKQPLEHQDTSEETGAEQDDAKQPLLHKTPGLSADAEDLKGSATPSQGDSLVEARQRALLLTPGDEDSDSDPRLVSFMSLNSGEDWSGRSSAEDVELAATHPAAAATSSERPSRILRFRRSTALFSATRTEALSGNFKPTRSGVLPDAGQMKKKVAAILETPEYNVEDYYKESGWAQACARSECFQNIVLFLIILYILWLPIDVDNNDADILSDAPWMFIVVGNAFCSLFTVEIIIRYLAFEQKRDCLKDMWFIFDSILVALLVWETWLAVILHGCMLSLGIAGHRATFLRVFRMVRMSRMVRVARVLHHWPEVMILIRGMGQAMKAVGATLAALLIIIYMFAFGLTMACKNVCTGEYAGLGEHFGDMPTSMNTLIQFGIFPETRHFIQMMQQYGFLYWCIACLFLISTTLTFLHMLMGIICESVIELAQVEKEDLKIHGMQHIFADIIHHIRDRDGSAGMVTREEFGELLNDEKAIRACLAADVDVPALAEFADFIFRGQARIRLGEFLETIIRFRGSNSATVKDLVDTRMFLKSEISKLERRLCGDTEDDGALPRKRSLYV